jgi:hypothetical protein
MPMKSFGSVQFQQEEARIYNTLLERNSGEKQCINEENIK